MSLINNTQGIAAASDPETIGVPQLFAGDQPAVATRDVLIGSALAAIPQYTPLKCVAGVWGVWADADLLAGVAAYAIPNSASDQRAAVYIAGCFNIDAIAWPASTTALMVENATDSGSNLVFRKLLSSDKRVTVADSIEVGDGNLAPEVG